MAHNRFCRSVRKRGDYILHVKWLQLIAAFSLILCCGKQFVSLVQSGFRWLVNDQIFFRSTKIGNLCESALGALKRLDIFQLVWKSILLSSSSKTFQFLVASDISARPIQDIGIGHFALLQTRYAVKNFFLSNYIIICNIIANTQIYLPSLCVQRRAQLILNTHFIIMIVSF